jgi:hypothetical protein
VVRGPCWCQVVLAKRLGVVGQYACPTHSGTWTRPQPGLEEIGMNSEPIITVEVDLPEQTLRALDALARHRGITRTQALSQAVATAKWLDENAPHGGKVIPR